jgi:Xaa-Pro aminopeptidase
MEQQLRKHERRDKLRQALSGCGLSALICSRNANVLMLSGYWPVVGSAIAIATAEPRVVLLVPEDEQELAQAGWADEIHTFAPAALDSMQDTLGAVARALAQLLPALGLANVPVACEDGADHVTASYVSQYVYGAALAALVQQAIPAARLGSAGDLLKTLRSCPTGSECERIRVACRIAARAFEAGAAQLAAGTPEWEAVLPFERALDAAAAERPDVARSAGFFYCMSGPNAAQAYAAYQRSRNRALQLGEPVLVHCNSCVDGYWTDLTRTYVLGPPNARLARMTAALSAAREAALAAIRPGEPAADVDRAARDVLVKFGYGAAFRHASGHGVGFSAIDHEARPRIHPCSPDILEPGMVFNIEPGIYIDGYGGLRDCNMVLVSDTGCEVLSPFHWHASELVIEPGRPR